MAETTKPEESSEDKAEETQAA